MRRAIAISISILLVFGSVACGSPSVEVIDASELRGECDERAEGERTRRVVIYFLEPTDDGKRLVPVERVVDRPLRPEIVALRTLFAGPREEDPAGLETEIPNGLRLLSVCVTDGVAEVNLPEFFYTVTESERSAQRTGQVAWTLTEIESIDAVRFLADGLAVEVFDDDGQRVQEVNRDVYTDLAPVEPTSEPVPV